MDSRKTLRSSEKLGDATTNYKAYIEPTSGIRGTSPVVFEDDIVVCNATKDAGREWLTYRGWSQAKWFFTSQYLTKRLAAAREGD